MNYNLTYKCDIHEPFTLYVCMHIDIYMYKYVYNKGQKKISSAKKFQITDVAASNPHPRMEDSTL